MSCLFPPCATVSISSASSPASTGPREGELCTCDGESIVTVSVTTWTRERVMEGWREKGGEEREGRGRREREGGEREKQREGGEGRERMGGRAKAEGWDR